MDGHDSRLDGAADEGVTRGGLRGGQRFDLQRVRARDVLGNRCVHAYGLCTFGAMRWCWLMQIRDVCVTAGGIEISDM